MRPIPLARPSLGPEEVEAQTRALLSGRLVLGPENEAFETALREVTGAAHAVAASSGTAALLLALEALALPPGSEVLVPAFTFPAPAHAVLALGLRPVAVDVEEGTWNMSPVAASEALGPRTSALLAVDQFGVPFDVERLGALADGVGVPIVEDAACALGATSAQGRAAGTLGAVGCFSFHPRKIVTTGEGGALVTGDPLLAERARELRHHGQRAAGRFVRPGLNLRLPEPAAAVGTAQLRRLPFLLAEREKLAVLYREALAASRLPDLRTQEAPAGARAAWQTFAVRLPRGTDRASVIAGLATRGVESGPATYALHRIGSTGSLPGMDPRRLPVADALHDLALALPLWVGMTESDVGRVVEALREALP